ncbi:MAG: class I SAM-dependent methyltransferase [Nitrospira sp.]|nr:class I SAM-dependent methyltransferase [Nitrospira sp.]
MKLIKPLPPNRSFEQILNQYVAEKSIAENIKKSSRAERRHIQTTMYADLFNKVPDHPRLTRRRSVELTSIANKSKFSHVSRFLNETSVCVEFAPGDCKFSFEVAKRVKFVIGVDISDQRSPEDNTPDNFRLIVYDGWNLNEIEDNSIDVVFSDQLVEHFHPEDTKLHFELVYRILKVGGKYIFNTPHRYTGPHDISKYFSYEAEGFHLKEWTYAEINEIVMGLGYSKFHTYWSGGGVDIRMPYFYHAVCESVLGSIPPKYIRSVARLFLPSLCGVAIK